MLKAFRTWYKKRYFKNAYWNYVKDALRRDRVPMSFAEYLNLLSNVRKLGN
jgi:hypothetical protein